MENGALNKLGVDSIAELDNLISHSYYCKLTTQVEKIVLGEGMDAALVSLENVLSKKLYSKKIQKSFPVIPLPYILKTIKRFLNTIN